MNRKFDFENKEFESDPFLAQINEISKVFTFKTNLGLGYGRSIGGNHPKCERTWNYRYENYSSK
jgi:hypothetical protein